MENHYVFWENPTSMATFNSKLLQITTGEDTSRSVNLDLLWPIPAANPPSVAFKFVIKSTRDSSHSSQCFRPAMLGKVGKSPLKKHGFDFGLPVKTLWENQKAKYCRSSLEWVYSLGAQSSVLFYRVCERSRWKTCAHAKLLQTWKGLWNTFSRLACTWLVYLFAKVSSALISWWCFRAPVSAFCFWCREG